MRILAGVFWVFTGLAVVALLAGNPAAINGVVGAGVLAVVFTALAWLSRA